MSGLVCVLDAEARPLMPMSAAYARTLQHQGKARVWPHPAFSVIQLTRIVASPVLRPVLLGIVLHPRTADLVVAVNQARSPVSHLDVGVDFRMPFRQGGQPRWASMRRRHRVMLSVGPAIVQRQATTLEGVITGLQEVLPISHLVILPSAQRLPSARATTRRIQRQLVAHTSIPVVQLPGMDATRSASVAVHPEFAPTLRSMLTRGPGRRPHVVAWPLLSSPPGREPDRALPRNAEPVRRVGRVCLLAGPVTGVITVEHPGGSVLLRVPIRMERHGIAWQDVRTSIEAVQRVWTVDAVALLPLRGTLQR